MADVISFPNEKKRRKIRLKKRTLCDNGNHKWEVVKSSAFDVQEGKLITIERCVRCKETRNILS